MAEQIHLALRHLEGRRVSMVLDDGSRILDALLISAGRPGLTSVWILIDGTDNFIPVMAVTEVQEVNQAA
jgi:Na+-translocating ferredoxin:NAD+ oxidoreductase RnfD subunit